MNFDIVVVGASSAGLHAAARLARAGKRVAVFEQAPELTPARRTLIVTPEIRRFLPDMPEHVILHRIPIMAVETPGAEVTITLNDPDLIIERNAVALWLLERAQAAGAQVFFGHRFQSFESAPTGTTINFKRRDGHFVAVTGGTIIGADGVFSDVATAAGLPHPPAVPILQAEIELPAGWDPALTKVWFDVHDTRYFYWLIPESATHGVVGLVGDDRAETRLLLQRFLARFNLQPLAYQGAQVAMHLPRFQSETRVGATPLYLVGESAGQVKVTTVGGTVTGFWGAEAAANAILHGTSYARELGALRRELDLHWLIRFLLERLDNQGYDRLVRTITLPVQRFLSERNRDDMAGGIWKLPFLEPQLISLALRILFRTGGPNFERITARRPLLEPTVRGKELEKR